MSERCAQTKSDNSNGRFPIVNRHSQREAHTLQDIFDFAKALSSEILSFEHVSFSFLNELTDETNVSILEAVRGTNGEFEFVDGAIPQLSQQGRYLHRS